ncbi:MAG TPA: maleylpyruvate isomerase family mycothiol-dependent enzyme [Pseudonocardiaceae bacterium]|jgi:maleylpyruvate isomerase|nr:maleylpyruvate isomerase family mycothiol-dependent enzyme [Pseudonocardiaceae bacterium]
MTSTSPTISRVRAAHARIAGLLDGFTDQQARADSALPGWSRGHVVTHLAELSRAFVRQAEYARAGRTIEIYDVGRPGRDAAIEAKAGRPAAELRTDLLDAQAALELAWRDLTDADWARPILYRDGVLLDTAFAKWRETEIHAADLDLGYRSADWPEELCDYLIDFLAPRLPEGVPLTVAAQGELTDVVAWLAGREPIGELTGSLPELGPWP